MHAIQERRPAQQNQLGRCRQCQGKLLTKGTRICCGQCGLPVAGHPLASPSPTPVADSVPTLAGEQALAALYPQREPAREPIREPFAVVPTSSVARSVNVPPKRK